MKTQHFCPPKGEIDEDDEAEHTFQSNGGDYDQYHEPCNSSFEPYAQPPVGIQVQPPTPKPRTHTPQKNPREEEPEVKKAVEKFSPRLVQSAAALKMLRDDLALALSEDSPEPVPMKQSSVTRKEKTPSPKVLSQQLSRSKVTPQATMMNTMPKVTPANRGGGGDLNHGMFKTPSTGAVPKTPRSQPGSGGSGFSRTPLPKVGA